MSKFIYTPGPWELKKHGVLCAGIERQYTNGKGKDQIVSVSPVDPDNEGTREWNALLISKAPEMFELLKKFLTIKSVVDLDWFEQETRKILKEIEGE